jgi:chemotaxis protein MotD
MTNVSAAATKSVTDASVNGHLGKPSSKNGDPGEFAQVLTGANSEAEPGLPGAEADLNEGAALPEGTPSGIRFNSLKELTSLAATLNAGGAAATAQSDAAGLPQAAVQPGPSAQVPQVQVMQVPQMQAAGAKAVQAAQQPVPQAIDGQVPQLADTMPATQAVVPQTPASSAPTEGEEIVEDLSLVQFAGSVTGVKRASPVPAEGGKAKVEDVSKQDKTVDGDEPDAATVPVLTSDAAAALSTEALLQLTASPTAVAPEDLSALSPVVSTLGAGTAAIDTDIDTDGVALPTDDSDAPLDFLTSIPDTATTADTKSFRFQKAGDAAVAISLSITKSEDGSAELQDSLPGTAKTETITVLDSRRFLGFGMGNNASNLLSAAAGDRDWAAAMHPASALSNAASASSTGNVVNTLKLQLNPDNLGAVTANMRLVGDELSIHLTVHSAMAYRELSEDRKPMLEALRAQGFNVDQVTISMAPAAADPSANTADQSSGNGNAQTQQQLSRDGEAARQQAQGQGRSTNQPDRNEMEKRNEIAVEAGIARGTGSGDIYL